jgi:hypothetical protein
METKEQTAQLQIGIAPTVLEEAHKEASGRVRGV